MKGKQTNLIVASEFQERFGTSPVLIKSPGRVNLIGEHTDYNEGFVLPAAVDKSIVLAMNLNSDHKARFYAVDKDEYFETDVVDDIQKAEIGWPNYLLGVLDQLRAHGYEVDGFDCVFGGDIPIGAGMSSSAALEGGVLFGLSQLLSLDISPVKMAQIAQKAENKFVGVQCGIMDQFASLNGKKDHAIKLDCRSLDYEYSPFDRKDIHIVLCDTGIRRELATSEYNLRRQQCEQGVAVIQKDHDEVKSLRDIDLKLLQEYAAELDSTIFQRCKYVIEENRRVLQACEDLKRNDFVKFGQLMYQSHAGLKNEYEVSCEELDTLVEIAQDIEGVIGSRMMGGGFGGCTINLVEEKKLNEFVKKIKLEYESRQGQEIKVYKTRVSGGTHLLNTSEAKFTS